MSTTRRLALALGLWLAALPATAPAQYGGAGPAETELPTPEPAQTVTPAAARTWIALSQPLSMPFADETPLEDVIKYIQTATQSPELAGGIPIYIDPTGLMEAEKTLQSPVRFNMEGLPVSASLRLLLKQLDLGYRVEPEGYVLITDRASLQDLRTDRDAAIARELAALRQEVAQLRALVAQQAAHPVANTAREDQSKPAVPAFR